MKAAKKVTTPVRGECLLSGANSEAKLELPSFGDKKPAWKAGTLPTELLPQVWFVLDCTLKGDAKSSRS